MPVDPRTPYGRYIYRLALEKVAGKRPRDMEYTPNRVTYDAVSGSGARSPDGEQRVYDLSPGARLPLWSYLQHPMETWRTNTLYNRNRALVDRLKQSLGTGRNAQRRYVPTSELPQPAPAPVPHKDTTYDSSMDRENLWEYHYINPRTSPPQN